MVENNKLGNGGSSVPLAGKLFRFSRNIFAVFGVITFGLDIRSWVGPTARDQKIASEAPHANPSLDPSRLAADMSDSLFRESSALTASESVGMQERQIYRLFNDFLFDNPQAVRSHLERLIRQGAEKQIRTQER